MMLFLTGSPLYLSVFILPILSPFVTLNSMVINRLQKGIQKKAENNIVSQNELLFISQYSLGFSSSKIRKRVKKCHQKQLGPGNSSNNALSTKLDTGCWEC